MQKRCKNEDPICQICKTKSKNKEKIRKHAKNMQNVQKICTICKKYAKNKDPMQFEV